MKVISVFFIAIFGSIALALISMVFVELYRIIKPLKPIVLDRNTTKYYIGDEVLIECKGDTVAYNIYWTNKLFGKIKSIIFCEEGVKYELENYPTCYNLDEYRGEVYDWYYIIRGKVNE